MSSVPASPSQPGKKSFLQLDEEGKRLNQAIKWPPKPTLVENFRGFLTILFLFLSSCFASPICLVYPLLFIMPVLGRSAWRAYNGWWSSTWWSMWIFILEKIYGCEVIMYGDPLPAPERALIISNHPSEADWIYWPSIAVRAGILDRMRFITKDLFQKVPAIGWATDSFNWLFLTRNWAVDKPQIVWTLQRYVEDKYPLSFVLYPEGTDFTPAKKARGIKYAEQNNLPTYARVLTPRVKGFSAVARIAKPAIDAVYDLTIAYPYGVKPTFWSAMTGSFPKTVYAHIRRFPASDLPSDKQAIHEWCYKVYKEKDSLLSHFEKHQTFPGNPSNPNSGKSTPTPASVSFWFAFWVVFTAWLVYQYFTSSLWFYLESLGFIAFLANAYSKKVRQLTGLAPPPGFMKKDKKSQ